MTTEQTDSWTVLRLLEWTTGYFKKRGADSPRLDAEVLLAEALVCSRIELYTAFNREPTAEQREAFREMVRRRGEGTPVAYLVGHKEFYSLPLRVNESTLIPRPETEHVVIEALDRAKAMRAAGHQGPIRVLDVGTGSGAIAVAIAKHLPEAEVTAVDVSTAALEIARYNIDKLELQSRVQLLTSDLLAAVPADPPFDLICSNPPYVSESEFVELDSEVREFEPRQALVAGPRGTEVIERLVGEAAAALRPEGWLILEFSPMIADACCQLVTEHGAFKSPQITKDLAGHARVLSAQRRPSD